MDARDRDADARDDRADLDDAQRADHDSEINEILLAADARDRRADVRDSLADRRDEAAALEVSVYGPDAERPFLGRRQAAKDRQASRRDRTAGHIDRFLLTGQELVDNPGEDAGTDANRHEADTQPGETDPGT